MTEFVPEIEPSSLDRYVVDGMEKGVCGLPMVFFFCESVPVESQMYVCRTENDLT